MWRNQTTINKKKVKKEIKDVVLREEKKKTSVFSPPERSLKLLQTLFWGALH